MRITALFLALSALLLVSCQPGGHGTTANEASDLLSEEWRQSKLHDALIQSNAIHHLALTVRHERFEHGGYDSEITDWINEINSEDVHRIADALKRTSYDKHRQVPVELLVGLVSPLLSDTRGYTETYWDGPPCGTLSVRLGNVSLSAANLIRDNAAGNRDLISVLTEFVLESRQPQCAAVGAVVRAIAYAASEPSDVELAAVVIFQFASTEPWMSELRPWEQNGEEQLCDPRHSAADSFTILRDRHPECERLNNGHLIAALKGWT